ncbi:peptidoglycan-binding protein [Candidatus Epulonipiscium fishelsonii]|uniref:Peptidoglycan-binding protein n=1 Tax=Candidatus Epulonipiscium fishelsonii TaxID=77094 RepID=A0ACC8XAZ9_9FIRM|nr:peptidoglycan-binding protein [Epulopiscium sp. SCG-B11WGA-EpuloA1]ONI41991.1 peptidoglycan-binding protein [Epulopiscium sp. SCG-B05WGA-EpuloA1]ONI47210.1 peptidoglycan-binding protein [Epulopiscium sp. SCG-C06WGA-EpuloA1]
MNPYIINKFSRQSFGTIIVEVTADPLFSPSTPLEDVKITISSITTDGEKVIVGEFNTNEVGQTPIITLECPAKEFTQHPNVANRPYSVYQVEAYAPNYIPVIVEGVQIFADTQSIQPITLVPMAISRFSVPKLHHETVDISIGPAKLYGNYPPKIPESEIKDTASSGFIVLDKVVVPEFVIVHEGSPNNNDAPNYTVQFKDYIKNVASSEIYPTWPTETIKANVIAIVSFTLNRVYTEWYRNQGKNFTITNSTAYDHAFFYGRDIFNSVSQVVDEVFNIYVKRPGVKQPLLTQYCDGVKVSCPNWMTQWGSQKLGKDGLSAEEILKYFYGYDIQLIESPEVQGIPESFSGSMLKLGSSGPAVRTIQEQLNRISRNYPLIPKVPSDGVFGEKTVEAVKVFQEVFHLTPDGKIGKATWYKISNIYVAVTKIGALL